MKLEEWVEGELGESIWKNKYQFDGETFEEFLDRVSNGNKDIRKRIKNKEFLFAGRILAHRQLPELTERSVCYSNCFVTEPPKDTIESIFDAAKRMARTYSYGGLQ